MTNAFFNPSGNPATGAEGLSSLIRAEFAAIGTAFDMIPQISTTGLFSTVFAQQANCTFTLPAAPGTLATTANVATETTRAEAAEAVLTTAVSTETTRATTAEGVNAAAIATEATARALLAPLASPALTGVPTAPTATMGTNTTQLATTAYVQATAFALTTGVGSVNARTGAVVLTLADIPGAASLASPVLTGFPTAPTAGPGTNTTQLATTAFSTAATAIVATAAAAAQTTANSASTAASAAQSTANSASTAASAAQSTANSASTAASTAQTTANTANTTANAALPKAGGTVSGGLAVSGSFVSNGGTTINGTLGATGTIFSTGAAAQSGTGTYITNASAATSPIPWTWTVSIFCTNGMSATGFMTVSDGRLKSNIEDITPTQGEDWVMRGRPRHYDMEGHPSAGFIAQEDIAAGRGEPVMFSADERELFKDGDGICPPGHRASRDYNYDVAYLTAALQSALARIGVLEARAVQ